MANWLKKWLNKLAEENNKVFSGKKLDCCELNNNSNKSTASQISNNKK